jgi:fructosamine-3-kinase
VPAKRASYDDAGCMALESEISWCVLRRILKDWSGSSAELAEVMPLVGGCINTTLELITKDGQRAVLKISPHRVNRHFAAEAAQLRLMRDLGLPAPQVYAAHTADLDNPHSYLLMEFIDGVNLNDAKHACTTDEYDDLQRNLAELVRALHARTDERYRREGHADAPAFDTWPAFYRHVYDPIIAEVSKCPWLSVKQKKTLGKLHERLDRFIHHDDRPRLVHWDIWATNILAGRNGDGRWHVKALLDPNCKYAHAEAEIAYMELFHTVTPAFLKAYQQEHKLGDGYHRVRKPIYQLYPMLNHVQLFGQEYVRPMLAAFERVAGLV